MAAAAAGDDDDDDDDNADDDDDDDDVVVEEGPLRKREYGSVIDYLEAKYVRGVMIDDLEREKKKKKGGKKDGEGGGWEEEGGDEDESSYVDSEPSGVSVYSGDDGFIDDTLLHEEVAGQVLASSAYGMTQIEEEAVQRRKKKKKKRRGEEEEEGKSEGAGGGGGKGGGVGDGGDDGKSAEDDDLPSNDDGFDPHDDDDDDGGGGLGLRRRILRQFRRSRNGRGLGWGPSRCAPRRRADDVVVARGEEGEGEGGGGIQGEAQVREEGAVGGRGEIGRQERDE